MRRGKLNLNLVTNLPWQVGVANLGDRDKTGAEFPFVVLSHNLDFIRVHFGGTSQDDNEGLFGGLDKKIRFLSGDLMLRSDIIQVNDQNDTIASFGFIYDLGRDFLIESWASFPTESGKEDTLSIKLNYVIKFCKAAFNEFEKIWLLREPGDSCANKLYWCCFCFQRGTYCFMQYR